MAIIDPRDIWAGRKQDLGQNRRTSPHGEELGWLQGVDRIIYNSDKTLQPVFRNYARRVPGCRSSSSGSAETCENLEVQEISQRKFGSPESPPLMRPAAAPRIHCLCSRGRPSLPDIGPGIAGVISQMLRLSIISTIRSSSSWWP